MKTPNTISMRCQRRSTSGTNTNDVRKYWKTNSLKNISEKFLGVFFNSLHSQWSITVERCRRSLNKFPSISAPKRIQGWTIDKQFAYFEIEFFLSLYEINEICWGDGNWINFSSLSLCYCVAFEWHQLVSNNVDTRKTSLGTSSPEESVAFRHVSFRLNYQWAAP